MPAKVYIVGQIGSTLDENGNVKDKGVELADVILQANLFKDVDVLDFEINSHGGCVLTGNAIAEYIASLPNAWTTAGAVCASIATRIHLAVPLERRRKIEGGEYFIHNPLLDGVRGNSTQLMAAADHIKEYETEMLAMYAKATGLEKPPLKGLMDLETNLTDQQCLSFKFVSAIIPKASLSPIAFYKPQNQNIFNLETMSKTISEVVNKALAAAGFKPKAEDTAAAAAKAKADADAAAAKAKAEAEKNKGRVKAAAAVKAEMLTTNTDVNIYTDIALADFIADPTKEIKVFSDEAKTVPMADGTYVLKDGSDIVVAAGKITEYGPGQVDASIEDIKAELATVKAERDELKADFEKALNEAIVHIKAQTGSTYSPAAATQTGAAQRRVIAQKGTAAAAETGLSMRDKAKAEREAYKKPRA